MTSKGTAEIGFSDHDIMYGMCKVSGPKQKMTNNVITRDLRSIVKGQHPSCGGEFENTPLAKWFISPLVRVHDN